MSDSVPPRRYGPDDSLPPYSYVPGRFPHPVSDPRGHSFGEPAPEIHSFDPERWASDALYLRGIDLFNHGYYWEAHETWEALWRGCDRASTPGVFLQGLIKIAAAGVKAREGRPEGVRRHARRSLELLGQISAARYAGLGVAALRRDIEEDVDPSIQRGRESPDGRVFGFALLPD